VLVLVVLTEELTTSAPPSPPAPPAEELLVPEGSMGSLSAQAKSRARSEGARRRSTARVLSYDLVTRSSANSLAALL